MMTTTTMMVVADKKYEINLESTIYIYLFTCTLHVTSCGTSVHTHVVHVYRTCVPVQLFYM